jgi:hypothetical protein
MEDDMGSFTWVWEWILPDIAILLSAVCVCAFIIRREDMPGRILLEFLCFCFLYAAIYENFATIMGWYGYGRSILMVGNVPLSVPIVEYLVVYSGIRLAQAMRLPTWSQPFFVGFQAMVFDFALDPVSIKLVRDGLEGRIGRWSWFPGPADAAIMGEPVYNFSGWVLLAGWAAAFILLGRYWWSVSPSKGRVGALYPVLAMACALLALISPLSQFLLWLAPFMAKGSAGEWIMLAAFFAMGIGIMAGLWRGRTGESLNLRSEWPIFLVFGGFHLIDMGLCLAPGAISALPLVLAASAAQWGMLGLFAWRVKAGHGGRPGRG